MTQLAGIKNHVPRVHKCHIPHSSSRYLWQAKGWPRSNDPMRFYMLPGKKPTDVFGWGYEEGHQRCCSMHWLLRYAATLEKPLQESAPWLSLAASKVPGTKSSPLLEGETEDTRALRGLATALSRKLDTIAWSYVTVALLIKTRNMRYQATVRLDAHIRYHQMTSILDGFRILPATFEIKSRGDVHHQSEYYQS